MMRTMKLLKLGNNDFDDDDSNNENSELKNPPKNEANCTSSIVTQFNDAKDTVSVCAIHNQSARIE